MGRVLVGCEFSGIVRDAFRDRGHYAMSCDLVASERPGPHYKGNVLDVINDGWDLGIFHPPCTYICNGSMNWINREPGRRQKMEDALIFVKALMDAPIKRKAIENPVGKINTRIRKPDQIIRAYQFGHIFSKDIALWLEGLPPLTPTHIVPGPHRTLDTASQNPNRTKIKSRTFKGVAAAMAEQWGRLIPPTG